MSSTYSLSFAPIWDPFCRRYRAHWVLVPAECLGHEAGGRLARWPASLIRLCPIARCSGLQSGGHALGLRLGVAVLGIKAALLGDERPGQMQQLAGNRTQRYFRRLARCFQPRIKRSED